MWVRKTTSGSPATSRSAAVEPLRGVVAGRPVVQRHLELVLEGAQSYAPPDEETLIGALRATEQLEIEHLPPIVVALNRDRDPWARPASERRAPELPPGPPRDIPTSGSVRPRREGRHGRAKERQETPARVPKEAAARAPLPRARRRRARRRLAARRRHPAGRRRSRPTAAPSSPPTAIPLGGHWQLLAGLPIDLVEPTPYQRDLSRPHVARLADAIDQLDRYLDPMIVVRTERGQLLDPERQPPARRAARAGRAGGRRARGAGDRSRPPDPAAQHREGPQPPRARARGGPAGAGPRRARRPARSGITRSSSRSPRCSRSASATSRTGGSPAAPIIPCSSGSSSSPPRRSPGRSRCAGARRAAAGARRGGERGGDRQLKARGFESPYLKAFVVARINPLRFKRGAKAEFDETLDKMLAAARRFDPARSAPIRWRGPAARPRSSETDHHPEAAVSTADAAHATVRGCRWRQLSCGGGGGRDADAARRRDRHAAASGGADRRRGARLVTRSIACEARRRRATTPIWTSGSSATSTASPPAQGQQRLHRRLTATARSTRSSSSPAARGVTLTRRRAWRSWATRCGSPTSTRSARFNKRTGAPIATVSLAARPSS